MRGRRATLVIVVLAAVAVAVFGVIRLVASYNTPAQAAPDSSIDGLTTRVTLASWVDMDHNMSAPGQSGAGYQMPPQMMPGMPTDGNDRLQLNVTVTNTTDQTRPFLAAEEFTLIAGKDGKQWQMYGDTFGDLPRLAPRSAVNGTLFFDLPAAEVANTPISLEWKHDGTITRVTVPIDGAGAPPSHGEHK